MMASPGVGPTPEAEPAHKVFFALRPPAEAAEQAYRLGDLRRRWLQMTGRAVATDRLHTSLNALGAHSSLPGPFIAKAKAAASKVAMPPFVVAFNRVGSWGRGAGRRPVVLWGDEGLIGVYALHAAIHAALAEAGVVRGPAREIAPHMTLWRDDLEAPQALIDPVRWTVREFVLLDSVHGEGRHELLGCWPLRAQRAGGDESVTVRGGASC